MADIDLTQTEADALIAMEKHRCSEEMWIFPLRGESITIPLQSVDARELFRLDMSRGRIDFSRVKMQNRGRQIVVLVRLDLGGPPHRNPDGEEISTPHMHVYREGYGDKWAFPVPKDHFRDLADLWTTLDDFFNYCNVTQPPHVEHGLFAC